MDQRILQHHTSAMRARLPWPARQPGAHGYGCGYSTAPPSAAYASRCTTNSASRCSCCCEACACKAADRDFTNNSPLAASSSHPCPLATAYTIVTSHQRVMLGWLPGSVSVWGCRGAEGPVTVPQKQPPGGSHQHVALPATDNKYKQMKTGEPLCCQRPLRLIQERGNH